MHQCSIKTGDTLKQYERNNKPIKQFVDFQRYWIKIKGVRSYQVCAVEKPGAVLPEKVPTDETDEQNFKVYFPESERVDGIKTVATNLIEGTPAQEVLQWLQENETTTEMLWLRNFTPTTLNQHGACSFFKLHLHHSKWFTIEHLMAFNSGIVIFDRSAFLSLDINKFLTLWLKESVCTRLMYLSIKLVDGKEFEIREVIAGVNDPEKIRVEGGDEIIEIKRRNKVGELTINANKQES
ncbi:hypothetical protein CAEBREN_15756 [Caenorhabditis brenneri]|uniref:Sdz-33 F-box domain-containing protein n=1 Tax=Caenorhabditis brenneri TaxID=135651 RepID=G0NNR7_CAEBE|nr:hypothetical protein CAEBREN_15756 [Caenorhabditis brenneri]